jgi:16S rRNA (cytosine1402-N4)-methyltransferase
VSTSAYHTPVLLRETLSLLLTRKNGIYVDGTVGGGGHAEAILEHLGTSGRLIGLDADKDAVEAASERLARFGGRVILKEGNFRGLPTICGALKISAVSGILLDLGVSSFQIDQPARGFSFRNDGLLDMRMDRSQPLDAGRIINEFDEQTLAEVLWKFGEEKLSRRIARVVVKRRSMQPIRTTGELVEAVRKAVGERFITKTLARVFQALRIVVNNELDNLQSGLRDAIELLEPGGRCVVLSYHSLEDRIVKETFKAAAATSEPSGHPLLPDRPLVPTLKILTRKPIKPNEAEVGDNPRARSAKLRAAEKI